ncbi:hypothetical protein [Sphingomonas sp.]|uniref:hypothetical protein n=1 Tax=Sphingomonas sp. TaxID=28214 RepID=UPI001B07FB88|nr:hypothetical protein [Sphingomonas sp.]MBO9712682.1 hypothetical protein [Sphingomonas sp.]
MDVPTDEELWEKKSEILEIFGVPRLFSFPSGVWEMASDLSDNFKRPIPDIIEIVATWFEIEVFEGFGEDAPLEIERRIVKWWMTIWGDWPANGNVEKKPRRPDYQQDADPEVISSIFMPKTGHSLRALCKESVDDPQLLDYKPDVDQAIISAIFKPKD